MEFSEIAAVSGKGGLFKVLKPTRTGVILESLDAEKKKLVVNAGQKVSVLSEISIYTTDAEGSVPLEQVFHSVHTAFKGDTGIEADASKEELYAFLRTVLPQFDDRQVYPSDIKKLVSWYQILCNVAPELLVAKKEEVEETAPKATKAKATKKKDSAA
jgi:hypothetical protein